MTFISQGRNTYITVFEIAKDTFKGGERNKRKDKKKERQNLHTIYVDGCVD